MQILLGLLIENPTTYFCYIMIQTLSPKLSNMILYVTLYYVYISCQLHTYVFSTPV